MKTQILGKFTKTHGYNGVIVLVAEHLLENELENLSEIFVEIEGLLVPFPVKELELMTDTTARIKLEFVNTTEEAMPLLGNKVYAQLEFHEQEAGLEQWIGFNVHDATYGDIGNIQQIEDYNGNIVLKITYNKKEILISLFPELVTKIDDVKKILYINAPEGYF